jgi:hypothetical protein
MATIRSYKGLPPTNRQHLDCLYAAAGKNLSVVLYLNKARVALTTGGEPAADHIESFLNQAGRAKVREGGLSRDTTRRK